MAGPAGFPLPAQGACYDDRAFPEASMTPLNRRDFLAGTLAGAGTLAVRGLAGEPAPASSRRAADRVPLGKTGLKVSRVGMGSGTSGWNGESNQTKLGHDGFARLVRHAYDRGLNFFDAADMYGSHAYYRKAFEKIPREDLVVATKINWRNVRTPAAAIDRFRVELGFDVLDIVLVHCATHGDWLGKGENGQERERRTLDGILEAKAKGIVRSAGVSCHGFDPLKAAVGAEGIDYHLVRINPFGDKMDAKPEEVVPVMRAMHDKGRAICGMKIIGEGALRDRVDESLKFVLGLGCVDTMTVGFEKTDEIDDLVGRMERILNA
jgi:aryl-alcohol dehydrogenase-like predicted oxidoreductase